MQRISKPPRYGEDAKEALGAPASADAAFDALTAAAMALLLLEMLAGLAEGRAPPAPATHFAWTGEAGATPYQTVLAPKQS